MPTTVSALAVTHRCSGRHWLRHVAAGRACAATGLHGGRAKACSVRKDTRMGGRRSDRNSTVASRAVGGMVVQCSKAQSSVDP